MSETIPEFSQRFIDCAIGGHGEEGKAWLAKLPDILEKCRKKWELNLGPLVDEIKGNYVGYARLPDGKEVILKVGLPHPDFSTEMEALAIYQGRGINRLIDLDRELNAMLLERIQPGMLLNNLDDREEQAEIVAAVIGDLHRIPPPTGHNLPHFSDWVVSAYRDARECKDLQRARPFLDQFPRVLSLMKELTKPDEPQLLLHGDLHHWNILLDEDEGWTAIDPKGVVGASCLEVGRFLGNALKQGNTAGEKYQILMNAIRILSDRLCQHQERIFAGALCDFVTANSWGLKEQPDPREPSAAEMGLQVLLEAGEEISTGLH